MRRMLQVFNFEFRRQGRRRGYLFVTIGIPLLALLIYFGYTIYQQARHVSPESDISQDSAVRNARPAGVVDHASLMRPALFSNLIIYPSESDAAFAMQQGRIGAYFVVAADYLKTGQIDMYYERFNLMNLMSNNSIRQALVSGLVERSGRTIDPAIIQRIQAKEPDFIVHTQNEAGTVRQNADSGTAFGLVYLFGLMLVFSAFTTSGYLMQSVVEEKETRMIEVVMSSVRPSQLLIGKILSLGLLGLIQMIVWGAAAIYVIRQLAESVPGMETLAITNEQFLVLLIYFLLGYLLFASAYASIGAISNSMREGPQLAAVVTLPAVIPLWATAILASAPDGPLAVGLSIFPLTAPLAMVMRAAVTEVPPSQLALSIGLLVLTIAFAMWLAGRLFRVNTLLAGHMPRLRDIPRLVRSNG